MAGAVIEYIAAQVDFPEIDVRQRLTVSKGYGVSEIYIPEGSRFVGRTIQETRLYEHDINVLTLYRGNKVIPNPKPQRELEPNDKLLCFGKLEAMRGMVPAKTRRRRQPDIASLPEDAVSVADVESVD
nr:TrkA C-terminal domain-containing protein [Microbulbifer yueqingensis]